MCSGGLAQMVERPFRMREVLGSIPGFSKDMAETFLLLKATFMFCFLLFLIVFLPVLSPYLSTVTVTYAAGDSCPPALSGLMGPWNRSWLLAVLQSLCYFLVLGERSPTAKEGHDNDLAIYKKPFATEWPRHSTDHYQPVGPLAQSAERGADNAKVVSSSLTRTRTIYF